MRHRETTDAAAADASARRTPRRGPARAPTIARGDPDAVRSPPRPPGDAHATSRQPPPYNSCRGRRWPPTSPAPSGQITPGSLDGCRAKLPDPLRRLGHEEATSSFKGDRDRPGLDLDHPVPPPHVEGRPRLDGGFPPDLGRDDEASGRIHGRSHGRDHTILRSTRRDPRPVRWRPAPTAWATTWHNDGVLAALRAHGRQHSGTTRGT